MVSDGVEAVNPVLRKVRKNAVCINFKMFFSPELAAFEDQQVQVTWDETDQGEQVWVGDLEGNMIGCARWMCLADYAAFLYAESELPDPLGR
jgi:hypothetical protein